MNLWFRMLWLLLTAWRRPAMQSASEPFTLGFRVLPTDVDFNIHLTNGRYLAIADIGRIDLALRAGLLRKIARDGWAPIVSYSAVQFRRELRIWQRFTLTTRIAYWDDEVQVFEHVFCPVGGRHDGEVAASILCVAALYDRRAKAFVGAREMLAHLGMTEESPPLTPRLSAFLDSYRAFKAETRTEHAAA